MYFMSVYVKANFISKKNKSTIKFMVFGIRMSRKTDIKAWK
jgi:hypothetical protein